MGSQRWEDKLIRGDTMRSHVMIAMVLLAGASLLHGQPDQEVMAKRVARLIRQLGDAEFKKREEAGKQLEAIGEPALEALRKAAMSDDPEISRRAGLVIQAISNRITRRELKELQGTWWLLSYETDGRRIKGEDRAHLFTFKEDKWSLQVGGQVFQGGTVARIEVREKLNTIDLLITQGSNIGATAFSVYSVEGNTLKYLNCGDPRPAEFTTKAGDGRHYLTLRRDQR